MPGTGGFTKNFRSVKSQSYTNTNNEREHSPNSFYEVGITLIKQNQTTQTRATQERKSLNHLTYEPGCQNPPKHQKTKSSNTLKNVSWLFYSRNARMS